MAPWTALLALAAVVIAVAGFAPAYVAGLRPGGGWYTDPLRRANPEDAVAARGRWGGRWTALVTAHALCAL
eukprot:gene1038-1341_t